MTGTRAVGALLALVTADLLLILVTGNASLLAPFGLSPTGGVGFAGRALFWGILFAFRFRILPRREERIAPGTLVLALLLLPTLVHFQVGPYHGNAVALGSLLFGFFALVLMHALLRRHFRDTTAICAVLLVFSSTFHYWYMVLEPTYAHATAAFLATLAITLWDQGRGRSGPPAFLALGLVLGLGICAGWQNGILLVLPALDLVGRFRREPRALSSLLPLGLALLLGAVLGAAPQMLALTAVDLDSWIPPGAPRGPGLAGLFHPSILGTLFSSRHGLLSWTPVFWAGYLGFLPLLRRRPQLGGPLLLPLLLMSWVNMCVAEDWGGPSFSGPRFSSLLPVFAFGFASAIDVLRGILKRRPGLPAVAAAACLGIWNVALAAQLQRGLIPRDDTVAFPQIARGFALVLEQTVGFPTTWPASWLFALKHGRPPGQYDLLAGRSLFGRGLEGRIDLGAPGDEAMLGEGWSAPSEDGGRTARRIKGRARVFAPLHAPEEIKVRIRLEAGSEPGSVGVIVNGREAGRIAAASVWGESSLTVPAAFWRREINEVVLETESEVRVDAFLFVRKGVGPRRRR